LKINLKNYDILVLVAGVIIILDQLTKIFVRSSLAISEVWTPEPWMAPYFRIVHWKNTGAAFGIGQDFSLVFTALAFVVSIVIISYFPRVPRDEGILRLALSMQLGGAVGNLIDRLTIGYVTDFISLMAAWNMPVFNIADLSITTGVIILVIAVWKKERQQDQQNAPSSSDSEPEDVEAEAVRQDDDHARSSLQKDRWLE
jgi:signal peptidase II